LREISATPLGKGPLVTPDEYHVLQLREVRGGQQRPFEEVRDQLAAEQLQADTEKAFSELSGRLVDLVYKNPTALEPAAKEVGVPVQVLGPFIELFENEAAGPAVMRYLAIGERKGIIRPRPASLRRIPLKISYESIIRLAQKASKTVSLKDFATTMGVATAAAKTGASLTPSPTIMTGRWVSACTR
jgi:hypothetical protein